MSGAIIEDQDSDIEMALGPTDQPSPSHPFEEEGELSNQEAGVSTQMPDQLLSEEQTSQETVRGIQSADWQHICEAANRRLVVSQTGKTTEPYYC